MDKEILTNPLKVKLITLGNSAVGKTSLMNQYCEEKFEDNYQTTLGIDFMSKNEKLKDDTDVKVRIYDTAGQEKFHTITSAYYNNCDGVIFVFALDDKESFD